MFGKMMNRFYYGKSGKGDYTREDLPQTRWQLFWEMLRVRFSALIRLNLLYMLFWLPTIIVIGRACMLAYSGMANLSELQMQVEAGELAAEALAQSGAEMLDAIRVILAQTLLMLIPCIAITGPATAGVAYVTRNWARDEHAFMWSDFIDALKENWKKGLLTSTITGFVPLLMYVCYTFYGDMAANSVLYILPQALVMIIGIVWMCSLMYIYPQIVTYDMKYSTIVRNSFIMTVGRLPMTIGLKLLSLLPAALCVLVGMFTPYLVIAMLIYAGYYLLIGFALSRFVGASYSNAVFDRYINVRIEGAQVNRGLYNEEEDDEDEAVPTSENTEA